MESAFRERLIRLLISWAKSDLGRKAKKETTPDRDSPRSRVISVRSSYLTSFGYPRFLQFSFACIRENALLPSCPSRDTSVFAVCIRRTVSFGFASRVIFAFDTSPVLFRAVSCIYIKRYTAVAWGCRDFARSSWWSLLCLAHWTLPLFLRCLVFSSLIV